MSRAHTQNGNSLLKKAEDDGELTSLFRDLTVEPNCPLVSRSIGSFSNPKAYQTSAPSANPPAISTRTCGSSSIQYATTKCASLASTAYFPGAQPPAPSPAVHVRYGSNNSESRRSRISISSERWISGGRLLPCKPYNNNSGRGIGTNIH